jgi:two-component system catabolic regulation response regulator CreB
MRSILLVEDEPSIADNIVYALKTEGFAPTWCQTGRDALQRLASETFALVILDVGLPDMNGFDVCRKIRTTSNVPSFSSPRAKTRSTASSAWRSARTITS